MKKQISIWSMVAFSLLMVQGVLAQSAQDGYKALESEQYSKAKNVFTQLASSAPSVDNYFNLGFYNLNNPQVDVKAAEEAFTKGAALDPKGYLNKVGLGAVKLAAGQRSDAKAIFDDIFKSTKGKDLNILYRLAQANIMLDDPKAKDPAEALKYLKLMEENKKFKPDTEYFLTMGDVYLFKNEGGDAMSAYEKAIPLGQKLAKIRSRMGQVWVQGKQYQKALDNFNAAVTADANFGPVYRQLGDFFVTYQKYANAAENFKKYLGLTDADDMAKLRYAKLAFTAQDYDNAFAVLTELKDKVKDPVVTRLMGMTQIEKGTDVAAGVANLNQFLSTAGADRILGVDYGFLGRGLLKLKDEANKKANDSLAIVNMQKAISMSDTSFDYTSLIATTYTSNRNFAKAAEVYESKIANSKKPKVVDFYNLGLNHFQAKNWTKSLDAWTKCAELSPAYDIAYRYIGLSNQRLDSADVKGLAAPAFEKYIGLMVAKDAAKIRDSDKKNMAYVYKYLGRNTLLNLKDIEKAKALYTKALETDPTDKQAIDAVARLNSGQDPFATTPAATTTTTTTTPVIQNPPK